MTDPTLPELRARLPVTDRVIERVADAPAGTLARVLAGLGAGPEGQRVVEVLARAHVPPDAPLAIVWEELGGPHIGLGWRRVSLLVECPGCYEEYRVGFHAPTWLRELEEGRALVWSAAPAVGCPQPTLTCRPAAVWRPAGVRVVELFPER